jgi:hypothetical protein
MRIVFSYLFIMMLSLGLNAQSTESDKVSSTSPTLEVSFSTFQTNPSAFNRNYTLDSQNGINSSNSLGFSISGRRTQSLFTDNLKWFVGLRVGAHAYNFNLSFNEDFRDLGTGFIYPYTTFNQSNYELFFADILTGLRYDFPIGKRMKIGVEVAGVLNYHFQNDIKHNEIAFVDMNLSQDVTVLNTNMTVNPDNRLIIAAQVGIAYQYNFENSGLRFAANTLLASNSVLEGNYQIFGDNETLEGTLTKDFSFGGFEIGYFWNLRD